MSWSILDIQEQIAIELDQSNSSATEGGTDWSIRMKAINRSNRDWSESIDWDVLHKTSNGLTTVAGNASYTLPTGFKKLDGFPKITSDGTTAYDFPIVDISKNRRYVDSDKFVNVVGNEKDGYHMVIHADTVASGASVQITYWANAASLASAVDVSECPDPSFLVQRSLYYLYKGREDGRFPEAKAESERILARMIESEASKGLGHAEPSVSVGPEAYSSWRIGRD